MILNNDINKNLIFLITTGFRSASLDDCLENQIGISFCIASFITRFLARDKVGQSPCNPHKIDCFGSSLAMTNLFCYYKKIVIASIFNNSVIASE